MQGLRLDHATLNTTELEESLAFYKRFLDLRPGWRPDFGFPGAWLYPQDGDYAIVHLIEGAAPEGDGRFDHIAFRGASLQAYLEKVKATQAWFRAAPVPGTTFTQVHHFDPNGVKIEVLFDEPLGAMDVGSDGPAP